MIALESSKHIFIINLFLDIGMLLDIFKSKLQTEYGKPEYKFKEKINLEYKFI